MGTVDDGLVQAAPLAAEFPHFRRGFDGAGEVLEQFGLASVAPVEAADAKAGTGGNRGHGGRRPLGGEHVAGGVEQALVVAGAFGVASPSTTCSPRRSCSWARTTKSSQLFANVSNAGESAAW